MAVKTLSHEKMKEIDKFMQETNLMKKFSHPNIVSLIGVPILHQLQHHHGRPISLGWTVACRQERRGRSVNMCGKHQQEQVMSI